MSDEDGEGSTVKMDEEEGREYGVGRRKRKSSTRYTADFGSDFEDEEDDEDDDKSIMKRFAKAVRKPGSGRPKKGTKFCPSCEEPVKPSSTVCEYCDYVFTSATRAQDDVPVAERFAFEPEREEDGSLKLEMILGRRRLRTEQTSAAAHNYHDKSAAAGGPASPRNKVAHRPVVHHKDPRREKYAYEYLVKFKNVSYLKTKWMTYHQIDSLGTRSKQCLTRWLKKLEKGDSEEMEDGTFDHNYCVVEKILDVVEAEIEVTDDEGETFENEEEDKEGEEEATESAMAPAVEDSRRSSRRAQAAAKEEEETKEEADPRKMDPTCGARLSGRGWFPMVRCRHVFNRIVEDEYSDWFYDPVDTSIYTDYLDIVTNPMCLAQIRSVLERPNAYDGNPHLFAADMRQIWKNCEEYNGSNPAVAVFQAGEMFSKMFERLFLAWVLNFEDENLSWEDAEARPWEPKCVTCAKKNDETHLLMCDNCEVEYHTYCLEPPLPDVPAGLWLCPRCEDLDLESRGNTHSHASEEAWKEKVVKGLKERKIVKQRLYLVKWKDLGYAWCTWEKAEDLKDDAKIEEFHKVNDSTPPEASVPQEDLYHQLSKKHYKTYVPSIKKGDEQTELEFQVYAQIRAMHFLKWGMIPPPALLKDCGPLVHAYSLLEEKEAEEEEAGLVATTDYSEEEAAKVKETRQEVALVLTELVDCVSKGLLVSPPGSVQEQGEYDVSFYRAPGETLGLNIGNYKETVAVMGFRESEGMKFPLERSGKVKEDDLLVAINGESVVGLPFRDVIAKLGSISGYMTLRFVQGAYRDAVLASQPKEERMRTKYMFPEPADGTYVQLPFQKAISTVEGSTDWHVKIRNKDRVQDMGKFKSKKEAASAFRSAVAKYHGGESAVKKYCASLNSFVSGGPEEAEEPELPKQPEDPADPEYEEGEDLTSGKSSSSWSLLTPVQKLVRAIRDSESAPDPDKWSDPFYYEEDEVKTYFTISSFGKEVRWVEQLDAYTGKSVRIYESIAKAAKSTTGATTHSIQQVLNGENLEAGGFKWRYADEATVLANKRLWEQRRHAGAEKGEDGEELWKKRLPTENKVFKDGNKLRDYQLLGVQWLLKCWYQRRSCILADEMGLGKTVQIVTMLEHIYSVDGLPGPFLVVVPLSTIEHWRREFEAWTDMRFCMYYDVGGARGHRDVMREYEWYYRNTGRRILKIHVLVTTYEALIKDYEDISEIPWRCIIVDEAHRLRNWRGKLHECLKVVSQTGLQAYGYQHRVLMTGTPLQNNTQELWSLLHYIEPTKFPDLEKFNERYGKVETVDQVQQLQKRLEPHLLRRTKEDVASDIPPKEETIIDVELTTLQKQYYRAIFERNHAFLYNKAGLRGLLPKLMNIQMELRKCCNHPYLVEGVEDSELEKLQEEFTDPVEIENARFERGIIASSGKMVLIDKLLPKLHREDHKVLIFSQMIRVLDLLEEFCEKRGFPVERLDGRVTGNQRQQSIDRFNTDPKSFVFLLSTRAGGVGINLTAADTVIIFDSDWNPQNDVQAQARCHRIGQTKEVQVYRLITRKSFESEMFDRASKKLGLEHAVLGGHNFRDDGEVGETAIVDKPSNKEMEQLLKQGAYALLDEDDEEAREFCEDDIDKIMAERTHRIVVDAPGKSASWLTKKSGVFRKRAFTSEGGAKAADVDVNDPDFWQKVMPDLKTPDTLDRRFRTLDDEEDEDALKESVDSFFKDLESMVLRLIELHQKGKCPARDREVCAMLLFKVSIRGDLFTDEQKAQATVWRSEFEGSRVRSCRQDQGAESEEDVVSAHGNFGRRRKKGSVPRDIDSHSDVCMVCFDGGDLIMCDGECKRSFHMACVNLDKLPDKEWMCDDCQFGKMLCLICGEAGIVGEEVNKCKKVCCGRFYHTACLIGDERVRVFKSGSDRFICAQHVCAECGERPAMKPDRENFFLQCLKCPTALHLFCAEGKPVRVLTHRSMLCDGHAGETAAPPLDLATVAHIKYPDRRGGPRNRGGRKPRASGEFEGAEEDFDDDFEEGSSTTAPPVVKPKGKPRGRAVALARLREKELDEKIERGEIAAPEGYAGPGSLDASLVADLLAQAARGTGSGDDAEEIEKPAKRTRRRREKGSGGAHTSSYVSPLIGPFREHNFHLRFKTVRDDGKKKSAKKEESNCPCGQTGTETEEQQDYIMCEKCLVWYHLDCAGIDKEEAAELSQFFCSKCDSEGDDEEDAYDPIVRIKYWKYTLSNKTDDEEEVDDLKVEAVATNVKKSKRGGAVKDVVISKEEAPDRILDSDEEEEEEEEEEKPAKKATTPRKNKNKESVVSVSESPTKKKGKTASSSSPSPKKKVMASATEDMAGEAGQVFDAEKLYCICRQPEKVGDSFIGCDKCQEWYHHDCMGLNPEEDLDKWVCPSCSGSSSKSDNNNNKKKRGRQQNVVIDSDDEEESHHEGKNGGSISPEEEMMMVDGPNGGGSIQGPGAKKLRQEK